MSDIRARVQLSPATSIRVGQQNATKVISSISGTPNQKVLSAYYADVAGISTNVVGGIASLLSLNVVGTSTFSNPITYTNGIYNLNGIGYFNNLGQLVSSPNITAYQSNSSYILTVDNSGAPIWTNTINGGTY
jgi:hypothetical protein